MARRVATAHWPSATRRSVSSASIQKRARFSKRAAIAVGAPVEVARQRVGREHAGGAVDVEDVEAGIDGALRRLRVHLHDAADVVVVGLVGVDLGDRGRGEAVEGGGDIARREVVLDAAGAELDAGKRAPSMHLVGHVAMVDDVAFVPQRGAGRQRLVDLGMDRAGFGAERRPAALRLDGAMAGIGARAAARRHRCIAAPGRSGSSGSWGRSGSARTAGRGGDRAAWRC